MFTPSPFFQDFDSYLLDSIEDNKEKSIPNIENLELIGEGSYGKVYKMNENGVNYALKVSQIEKF